MSPKKTWSIELPFPVSVNRAYGSDHNTRRRFLTKEAKSYKTLVKQLIMVSPTRYVLPFKDCRVGVRIQYIQTDAYGRDIQNYDKLLLDAFQEGGVYPNDSMIDDKHIWRTWRLKDPEGNRIIVEVREL